MKRLSALFGGYTIYDIDNITEGTIFIDGFCISEVSGGAVSEFTVTGHLENLTLPGTCKFEWFGCEPNFVLHQETMILTPIVANELATWSLIKASYR